MACNRDHGLHPLDVEEFLRQYRERLISQFADAVALAYSGETNEAGAVFLAAVVESQRLATAFLLDGRLPNGGRIDHEARRVA